MPRAKPGIIIRKTGAGLVPASAIDAEQLDAWKIGTEFDAKPRTKRSNPQNRLYWKILANVLEATSLSDLYPTSTKLHEALLRGLGYVTVTYDLDGAPHLTPDSTAFNEMDAEEFRTYFDKAMVLLAETTGVDPLALHS